jgi:hypothetical protein
MHSDFASPGYSMTSGIALYEANARSLVEVDAKPDRPLVRPASYPAEISKKTLRKRPCRPLRAVIGAAYGLAEASGVRPAVRDKILRLVGSAQRRWQSLDLGGSGRSICQKRAGILQSSSGPGC